MAESQIRYCTTEDGVRIAYSVSGRGEQWLIHTPNFFAATLQYGAFPFRDRWINELGKRYRLVLYDPRGTGLSQREVEDLTLDGLVRDLEAVADAVRAEQSVLLGFLAGCFVAVWYAAAHPERVSHLALWLPPILRPDTAQFRAGARLATDDWEAFTEYFAHAALGWDRGEEANAYARSMRETITRENFLRGMTGWFQTWGDRPDEAYEPASRVEAPTLCMQRADYPEFPRFVAPLRRGSMRVFAGRGTVPYQASGDEIVEAIAEFTGAAQPGENASIEQELPSGSGAGTTAVILFTDIVDSTALTERLGDARFREMSRTLDAGLRKAIRDAGGVTVEAKTLGDGVLATFGSAAQAIEGARRCLALSAASELGLHIGVHAGDVIREDNNVYGGAVNIASRICGLSAPGEILVTDVVRGMARSSSGVLFEDLGEQALKGIEDPVRVFAVRAAEAG